MWHTGGATQVGRDPLGGRYYLRAIGGQSVQVSCRGVFFVSPSRQGSIWLVNSPSNLWASKSQRKVVPQKVVSGSLINPPKGG
jgi:hypothetical protein